MGQVTLRSSSFNCMPQPLLNPVLRLALNMNEAALRTAVLYSILVSHIFFINTGVHFFSIVACVLRDIFLTDMLLLPFSFPPLKEKIILFLLIALWERFLVLFYCLFCFSSVYVSKYTYARLIGKQCLLGFYF